MRYHNITKDDMLNGDGLRVVLWVAGCEHHCPGCQNPLTWDKDGGIPFDASAKEEIFAQLEKNYISGITFSGGDPLAKYNREETLALACEIKEKFPGKTIWCYTGYTLEELQLDPMMEYFFKVVDVIVDGPFVEALRDVTYHWAGSTNQRIIRFKDGVPTVDDKEFGNYDPDRIISCPSCHN